MNEEEMWRAVVAHDPRADGRFVYGVTTTGVYCRPTCGARRPSRRHVRFFASAHAAEAAGFRPCRRCRPRDASPHRALGEALARACAMLRASDPQVRLGEVARSVGLSPARFHRAFKAALGITPREYAETCRWTRLQAELPCSPTVAGAIYAAGFGSGSRVYERAGRLLGMTPGQYRSGGEGVPIRLAVSRSSLGWVGVAATPRGLCAVELGDSGRDLKARLLARFPHAVLAGGEDPLTEHLRRIVRFIDDPGETLALPLDIRGTAFQRRVWKALQDVALGATVTYGEVARAIGMPTAVRAVARACALNPLAIVVPCHRVVRKDGTLGGYRWGVDRKRRLLEAECRSASVPQESAPREPRLRTLTRGGASTGGRPPESPRRARPRRRRRAR